MLKLRHLIWTIIAAVGLVLSTSQSFAQQSDPGDQPGLLADDSVELDPEFRRTMVLYRTSEAPGTIIIHTAERFLYVIRATAARCAMASASAATVFSGRACSRSRASGMAGLAPPPEMIAAPALSAALHGRRPRQSARRPRALSRRHGLSHPRHQPAGDDRQRGLLRLLPAGQSPT